MAWPDAGWDYFLINVLGCDIELTRPWSIAERVGAEYVRGVGGAEP
ncbi:MAG: hypothetical protein ACJ78M_07645 [Gemmatimonadaceae bacterium]